jgi:hypothetical protein
MGPSPLGMRTSIAVEGNRSPMKVIGINGSARRDGNTAILIKTVFEELEKAGIELTDSSGSSMEFSDRQMLEYAIAMYGAAGKKYKMIVQFPISPLRFNPLGLASILDYQDRDDVDVIPVAAPIPQAGLTAPLDGKKLASTT